VDWVESCDAVDALLEGEEVIGDTVDCAVAEGAIDTVVGGTDVICTTATELADLVAEGVAEAPVPIGTFWR